MMNQRACVMVFLARRNVPGRGWDDLGGDRGSGAAEEGQRANKKQYSSDNGHGRISASPQGSREVHQGEPLRTG